ncbi:phage portal protein [Lactobacillus gasseri]|uniref:phage portal protein n=1 Tax=Lactobacillus gasseri TaxID=1596 RepID=UPI003313E3A4
MRYLHKKKKDLDGNTNGYSITVYMPQRIVEYRTKMSMEVSANDPIVYDGVNLLSQSIENDIHKISYVPNMNDEKFMGNVSGEAMKFKLFGLENLLSIKQRYFFDGLRRRLKLIQTIVNIKGANEFLENILIVGFLTSIILKMSLMK